METQQIAIIQRTDEPDVYNVTKHHDDVVNYALSDGIAVLNFADGSELRIEGALGFAKKIRHAD